MWIYIILGIVVILTIYVIATFNGLTQTRNRVDEAFATMDVYLKKRWDLIPNLVETVKGYMAHEKSTLKEIVELRNNVYDKMTEEDKVDVNNKLTQGISKLFALAESYPDLKANQNFMDLSAQLAKVEDDIANSRKYYNGAVRNLNDKVQMFPGNMIAGMLGFKTRKMFEAAETEKENVKVSL